VGRFVGPDNGIFTPIFEEHRVDMIVEIKEKRYYHEKVSPTFHGRDVFAPVSAHLSLGSIHIRDLGVPVDDPVILERHEPAAGKDVIQGSVIRCDRFGNIITNVSGDLLMEFLGESEIAVEIAGNLINHLEETYSSIETGQLLALIGSSGLLEVSVNGGDAGERLGVKVGDAVVIRRGGR
jgi:S-adenosylmethionine hydrolase